MNLSAYFVTRKTPVRFILMVSSHLDESSSATGARKATPALLTRTSILPLISETLLINPSTSLSFPTSHKDASTLPPLSPISFSTAFIPSWVLAHIATIAPSLANPRAISLPIPLPAPVITTTSSFISASLSVLETPTSFFHRL